MIEPQKVPQSQSTKGFCMVVIVLGLLIFFSLVCLIVGVTVSLTLSLGQ